MKMQIFVTDENYVELFRIEGENIPIPRIGEKIQIRQYHDVAEVRQVIYDYPDSVMNGEYVEVAIVVH
jgi:hypothetical protein